MNLHELLDSQNGDGLPESETLEIISQLLEILGHIHGEGFIHRDVKPENILYDEALRKVYLIDFDLAMDLADPVPLDDLNKVAGTIRYMSPEQIEGNVNFLDARSDLYSVGTVLYTLIEGRPPFEGHDFEELEGQIRRQRQPKPQRCTEELAAIIDKALEKEPHLRWQSATRFISELQRLPTFPTGDKTVVRRTSTVDAPSTQLEDLPDNKATVGNFATLTVAISGLRKLELDDSTSLKDELSDNFGFWAEHKFKGQAWSRHTLPFRALFGWPSSEEHAAESALKTAEGFLKEAESICNTRITDPEKQVALRLVLDAGQMQVEPKGSEVAKVNGCLSDDLLLEATPYEVLPSDRFADGLRVSVAYPMVGRNIELQRLGELWEDARNGHFETAIIRGEAGMGKSRLLNEFIKSAQGEAPMAPLQFACSYYNQDDGFHPIRECLLDRWNLRGQAYEEARRDLQQTLEQLDLASHYGAFEALLYPAQAGSVEIQAPAMQRAVTSWVRTLTRRTPLLLTIEDLHWCDPSSLGVFQDLASQAIEGLFILGTTRPEGNDETKDHLINRNEFPMNLRGLRKRDIEELIGSMAEDEEGTGNVDGQKSIDEIKKASRGTPLHIIVLMRSGWKSGDPVPAGISGLLIAQIGKEGINESLLRYAALLGQQFTKEILARLLDGEMKIEDIEPSLQRLKELSVIRELKSEGPLVHAFDHALTRHVFLDQMLRPEKNARIERILAVIEGSFPNMIEDQPKNFAEFNETVEKYTKAIELFGIAANRNLNTASYEEAANLLRKAISLLDHLPADARDNQDADFHLILGRTIFLWRGYGEEDLRKCMERVRDLTRNRSDQKEQHVTASWLLGAYYIGRAELENARRTGEEMEMFACEYVPGSLHLAYSLLTTATFCGAKYTEAEAHARKAIDLHADAPDPFNPRIQNSMVIAHGYRARALHYLDRDEEAFENLKTALKIAERENSPWDQCFALHFTAWLSFCVKDYKRAREVSRAQVEIAEKHGFQFWEVTGEMYTASTELLAETGDAKTTMQKIAKLRELTEFYGRQIGIQIGGHRYQLLLAALQAKSGDPEGAIETLSRTIEHVENKKSQAQGNPDGGEAPLSDCFGLEDLYLLRGDIRRKLNLPDDARQCYEHALEVSMQTGSLHGVRVATERLDDM